MDDRLAFLRQASAASTSTPVPCTFKHEAAGAEGQVELNYWPAKRGDGKPPAHLLLFILGNPGLLGYYPHFLTHLHSLLPPTHAILATSHIGHSTVVVPSPAHPLDLPQQVDSKVELVQALRGALDGWAAEVGGEDGMGPGSEGEPVLALMGHSVGAWMLCEVMKRLNVGGERPVSAGYLLFPTLGWIANTWNGWTLWPIFHRPFRPLLPLLSPLLRPVVPFTSLPPTSRALVASPTIIAHVLHLSASEMQLIREPDLEWFRSQGAGAGAGEPEPEQGRGLYGVWAGGNGDGWVGRDGPMIQECLGGRDGGRVQIADAVPHAFCLTDEHSEMVAEMVARWIRGDGPRARVAATTAPVGSGVMPM